MNKHETLVTGMAPASLGAPMGSPSAISSVGTMPATTVPSPFYQGLREAIGSPSAEQSARATRRVSRDAIYRRSLAVADVVSVVLALELCRVLSGPDKPAPLAILTAPLIVLVAKVMGLYDRGEWLVRKSTLDEAPALFQLATLVTISLWLINGAFISHVTERRELLIIWPAMFVALLSFRVASRWICRHITASERCLVVGDPATCERVRTKLGRTASLHAQVVAQISLADYADTDEVISELSHVAELRLLTESCHIDRIIVAPERADADEVLNLIRVGTTVGVKVSVVPRVLEVIGSSAEFDDLEGVPLLSMRCIRLSRSSQLMKRGVDVVGSVLALILLAPLLAMISLLVKLDSKGPILYHQPRVGRDGETFEMLKFRTMVPNADERRHEFAHLNQADGLFKIDNDPRITRIGSWLRRLSLDELPQLLNVVRGDMSLVGPRPLIAEEDERIQGWHRRRLQLTPGMTGHWQILGSARIPLGEMVKIDYLYVTNWSLWLDLKILLRTVAYMAARKGM
jgi:exopolysaccharide biosynthesis polyprenyl glycosylphosphotransferase